MNTTTEPDRATAASDTSPVTPQGNRTTWTVMALRLGVSLGTAATLVTIGTAFAQTGSVSVTAIILATVFALLAGGFAIAEAIIGGLGARAEERRVRAKVLAALFRSTSLPKNNSEEFGSARLIQLMTDNAERLTDYRQQYLGSTIAALITPFLVILYVAIAVNTTIGLGMFAGFVAVPLLVASFLIVLRKVSTNSRAERAKLTAQYLDALRNLTTIQLFGAGERIEKRLRDQGERNRRAIMRLLAGNQLVIIVLDGVFSLVFVCWSVFLIAAQLGAASITLAQALTVVLLLTLLLEPLQQVAGFFYVGMGGQAASRAIGKYLSQEQQRAGADQTRVCEARVSVSRPAAITADADAAIEVAHLAYDYGRGKVLHDVRLRVERGQKFAIIGRSGNGKSTLVGLLRGSLAAQSGRVVIAGRDLQTLTAQQIRALTSTVSQSTWLFTGTIADNLRLAHPAATTEQMWQALAKAKLAEEVRQMPLGLDTEVGERGSMLSGGQAQRISLARAFIAGRDILLLDEPTSQVDLDSEQHIVAALAEAAPEVSMLIVTHRHSLLEIADSVYEMNDGRLTEVTNHAE